MNRWESILSGLNIAIPANHKHGACPHCGGKDRFRFDDLQGRGTWICNNCGVGNGLKLILNVFGCSAYEAAEKVANYLCLTELKPIQPQCKPDLLTIQKRVNELLKKVCKGKSLI